MESLKLDLEIYDIWYQSLWNTKYFILISLIILFIGSIFLIKFLKKTKQKNRELSVSDLINDLNLLKNKIDLIDSVTFYSELTLIIKKFILINYKENYFCKTENELISFFESQNIPIDFINEIKDLMINSQQVKFAKAHIVKMQMDNNLNKCLYLIMTLNKISDTTANNKTT